MLYYWPGATFRQRAGTLHTACITAGLTSTLDGAAQKVLTTPTVLHLVDQPLDELDVNDRNVLSDAMRGLFLKRELRRCLGTLTKVALGPLVTWLRKQGATGLTLIPCGWLALFPLAAATLADGSTMGETLPTSIAPGARSLLHDEHVAVGRSGVSTIGNPRPTNRELFWSEAEARTLVNLARRLGKQGESCGNLTSCNEPVERISRRKGKCA